MTARRLSLAQIRERLDLIASYGIPLAECGVDIGPDYVKVSPPANSNAGDSLGLHINRNSHNPKKAKGR